MPELRLAYRPFPAQLEFFRRKVNVPSARWDDLWQGDHAHGFMVAGVARMEVLEDLRTAVQEAIGGGETLADFRARFDAIVAKFGWPGGAGDESAARRAWRTRVIYQTNLRTSYMAGRWERLKDFPYLRYQHNTVANPREQHKAWDGLVLASDDPWWQAHYPPNGWGCRCTVTGVGPGRLRQLGKTGPDPTPGAGPGDPPPEWAYHVGEAARSMPAAAAFGEKVVALPPTWRASALADAQRRSVQWFGDWRGTVDDIAARIAAGNPRPTGAATPVGFLPDGVLQALAAGRGLDGRGFEPVQPATALVAVTDRTLYHSLRKSKWQGREELRLPVQQLLGDLPTWARHSDTLWFWSKSPPTLTLARPMDDGRFLTVAIRLDAPGKGAKDPAHANWIRTVEVETVETMRHLLRLAGGGE